jgi:hypothetical protein
MIKTLILIVTILTFTPILVTAQNCEDFDKSLFHMLPDTFPNKINCIDSLERKQGWWINYTLKYNPIDKPDELAKGNYVESYSYGKYKNNLKIGEWISVANAHLVYVLRRDNYYYSEDTVLITSGFANGGWNESTLYFNADSTIIKSTSLSPNEKFPICIECNRNGEKGKECIMTYRNETIKFFSFDHFDMEFYSSFIDYNREKKSINEKLDE